MAQQLSEHIQKQEYDYGRHAAQSVEAREKIMEHNDLHTEGTLPSPLQEMARMNVMHVHDRIRKVVMNLKHLREEVQTCLKHHEVSLLIMIQDKLAKAHGDNVIDKAMQDMFEATSAMMKAMGKFHSSNITGEQTCPKFNIASLVEPSLMNAFDEVAKPPGIRFPPPARPGMSRPEPMAPSFIVFGNTKGVVDPPPVVPEVVGAKVKDAHRHS